MSSLDKPAFPLASVLNQRRWQVCTRPFPHFIARDLFTPEFYSRIDESFGEILDRGLCEGRDAAHFSRNISGYDAYSVSFTEHMPAPLHLFISKEWHDMLAQVTGVRATCDVAGGFHHHRQGSRSGEVHNDLNPGWFADCADVNRVNLCRDDVCDYSTGAGNGSDAQVHVSVRAVAVLFFLHNDRWQEGYGGETGLYSHREQDVSSPTKAFPPLNNSLLMFECRPNSYHSFIENRGNSRNSMIMWLHRPRSDVVQRWGEAAIVGWDQKATADAHEP